MAEQRRPDLTGIDHVLETLLKQEPVALGVLAELDAEALCRAAEKQGVLPLVAEAIALRADAPLHISTRLKEATNQHVATDLVREAETRRMLSALDRAGVAPLLMKGTALAYSHYSRPDLRPRVDTDILIPIDARGIVDRLLTELGYVQARHVSGDLLMYQASYSKPGPSGRLHSVDVHWRIANPQAFADWLAYDELSAAAAPVPQLHPAARALSSVHALLLACVHRVAHHLDSRRLVWLYDIHLIASRLDSRDWRRFGDLAVERRVAAVCLQSLGRAADILGTVVPRDVTSRLESGAAAAVEPTAAYLTANPRRIQVVVSDLRSLPTWTARWRLLREHLLPTAQYMREVYAPSSHAPLALLYAWRAIVGARKYLTRG